MLDIANASIGEKNKRDMGMLIYDPMAKFAQILLKIDEERFGNADEIVERKIRVAAQIEKGLHKRMREDEGRIEYIIYTAKSLLNECNTREVQKIGVNIIGNILYAAKDEKNIL
jgi:hypothetical protein